MSERAAAAAGLNSCPARMTRSNKRRAAAEAALLEAAARADCSAVQLLANGVQVNSTDAEGATALHKAAAGGHAAVGAILLAAQADPMLGQHRTLPCTLPWTARQQVLGR